ncbi:MAG: hypothetical protein OEL19_09750, partial [Sulfurimonas sp.]|nr:hypothetical protein [Sulfurimonas sp.]
MQRLFKNKNLNEVSQDEMNANIGILEKIYEKIKELNRQNELLKQKYQNDEKYARIHKRLMQNSELSKSKIQVFEALSDVKKETDEKVLNRNSILENEDYFRRLMMTTVI